VFIGRAPLRISFAGGGTDLEEYHNKYDGYAISSTINKYTYVIAKLRNDDKLQGFSPDFASHLPPTKHSKLNGSQGHEIIISGLKEMKFSEGVDMYLASDVEPNSGLGASSSLTSNLVNVILKMQGKKWKKLDIAMKAYHIGHDILKWGIGKQDEFAAVYGGLNIFKYTKEKVTVKPIKLNNATFREFQKNSLLFRIGKRKHSANILQKQIKNINKSKIKTLNALHTAKNLALEMTDAFRSNDLEKFNEILNEGWKIKKQFATGISNPRIEKISKEVLKYGAQSLKVTGAGGGGHMFVYADTRKHESIEHIMKKLGAEKINFTYQNSGARVFDINNL
jgi:D-glycero-alpha-D-manno-heptose-7-phosphate kinase